MEGVAAEASSLAGHLGLGKLNVLYDDNRITIDGPTDLALSDDAVRRFEAYGWHVTDLGDVANDTDAIEAALRAEMEVEDAPSLVVLRSHIGYPSPAFTDTAAAHGSPFGDEEVAATKALLGLPPDETFFVPDDVVDHYRAAGRRGQEARSAWEQRMRDWDGDRAALDAALAGRGLAGWEAKLPTWQPGEQVATRKAAKAVLDAVVDVVPGLVAGGADLTGNTGTELADQAAISPDHPDGRQLYFGVREHAMGAVMVGMAHHGGLLPAGGTFLVFSDYMRGAVRLAALSGAHLVFVWSHDSVGLGEDGPTHQPIEHLASLRAMPDLRVIRPADANEVAEAWQVAIDHAGPTALVLSRQGLPTLAGTGGGGVASGAYVLRAADDPSLVLVGTGSEVAVCLEAADRLAGNGTEASVVSMPSWELFADQPDAYQSQVLPPSVPKLSVEAAATLGWERWVDEAVGIDRFGASAPGATALENLGISTDHVVERAATLLGGADR